MLGQRWCSHADLIACRDNLVPPTLPALLVDILAGQLTPLGTLNQ